MSEVASRLQQTEQRAAAIVAALDRQKSVKDSLVGASEALLEVSSAIVDLAREAKRATDEFQQAVLVLQRAGDILDPAALQSSLDSINRSTIRIAGEITNLRDHVDAELKDIRGAVKDTERRTVERLRPRSLWKGLFGRRKR
ncbi:MAG: hypothetical protein OXU68_09210 [Bacteroidota bacterium]|nr:hypothetical protein [Bacteroidota bacterium]